jgi:hypothetical protein
MISPAESGKSLIDTEVSHRVLSRFHQAKDFFTQTADTFKETTQQAKTSLVETTDKAVDRVTAIAQQAQASMGENVQQTKESLEQTIQSAGQIKSPTSEAIQVAVSSAVSDWLQDHPAIWRLLQMLTWATNHPILSLIILLFTMAIAGSLIKSIGRLFEMAWLSILQAPLKLGRLLIRVFSHLLNKFGSLTIKNLVGNKNAGIPVLQNSSSELNYHATQQRLLEISTRLEALQEEQNELLQEALTILKSDKAISEIHKDTQHQKLISSINDNSL